MKKLLLALVLFSGLTLFSQSQIFTVSGTFTVPLTVTSITIEVVGGGGDGGNNGAGGGGGGGYAKGTYTVIPNSTHTVTVGTGGNGPSLGTSSVGTFLSATGGANGVSVPNPNVGGGGAGGIGTGGTIVNRSGGNGGGGYWTYFGGGGGGAGGSIANGGIGGNTITWTGQCITPGGAAGTGGGAPGGAGGKGAGFTDANCTVSDPVANGVNYGGGGGGENGIGTGFGNGANGVVIISWGPTGVPSLQSQVAVAVGSNPFTDKIILTNTTGKETFELMNAVGQVVWAGTLIEQKDFSTIAKGVYFLKISGEQVQTVKLLKQ